MLWGYCRSRDDGEVSTPFLVSKIEMQGVFGVYFDKVFLRGFLFILPQGYILVRKVKCHSESIQNLIEMLLNRLIMN